jgi:hypothetical protein
MLGTEQLIAEQRAVRVQGVNSVPTFFVNGEAVTSGAHKPELLAAFLGQALGPGLSQCSSENGTCGLRPAIEAAVYGGIALGAGIGLLVSAKRRRRFRLSQ